MSSKYFSVLLPRYAPRPRRSQLLSVLLKVFILDYSATKVAAPDFDLQDTTSSREVPADDKYLGPVT